MEDPDTKNILQSSPLMRHLVSRQGTLVKIHCRPNIIWEGEIISFDLPRAWLEGEGKTKSIFINMHKITAIEAMSSEETVNRRLRQKNSHNRKTSKH